MSTIQEARAPTGHRGRVVSDWPPSFFGPGRPSEPLPMPVQSGDAILIRLVESATSGDQQAWRELVQRYTPLVNSVLRRYQLSQFESEDIGQAVWLRLIENLARIREPLALPGWITTTTRNEALRAIIANRRRARPTDWTDIPEAVVAAEDAATLDELMHHERYRLLRDGLLVLSPKHRVLLLLLHSNPVLSYAEVARMLHIPVGSIGPTRARCLRKLRATKPIRALIQSENEQR